jgi:glyoxylase-like metal-dependent hydrolase (beta-lactamase superfamily II)
MTDVQGSPDTEHSVRPVGDGIFCLGQKKGGRVHAFLVEGKDGLTLIDTLYDTDGAFIAKVIQQMGRPISDLKNIVLTHAHRSHLGGLAALKALSGAKVWAHEWESDIIAGERKAQAVSVWPRRPLRVYHLQLGLALGFGAHPPCEVDAFLKDGDWIGPLQVVYAPGHSPGHLAFYWKESRTLFAGDSLATWPYLDLGWAGLNLNKQQCLRSLLQLDDLNPDMIAVGHGEPAIGEQVAQLRMMIRTARAD